MRTCFAALQHKIWAACGCMETSLAYYVNTVTGRCLSVDLPCCTAALGRICNSVADKHTALYGTERANVYTMVLFPVGGKQRISGGYCARFDWDMAFHSLGLGGHAIIYC